MTNPTTAQLQTFIPVISKVVGQISCFHIFEAYLADRFEDTEPELALKSMTHNAALDSALIHLRAFNEFFKPGGRADDIRAHQYPSISLGVFLTEPEEAAINKHLAHLTLPRIDIVANSWKIDDMVIRGLRQGITFLTHIDTISQPSDTQTIVELRGVCKAAQRLISKITKQHAEARDIESFPGSD